jgi:hypothetical protein
MERDILEINILSIAISGLFVLIAGMILYYFKENLAGGSIRFFLPIPPIGVAAYIFVFGMFKHYQGIIPGKSVILSEIVIASLASALFFIIFTATLIFLVGYLKGR